MRKFASTYSLSSSVYKVYLNKNISKRKSYKYQWLLRGDSVLFKEQPPNRLSSLNAQPYILLCKNSTKWDDNVNRWQWYLKKRRHESEKWRYERFWGGVCGVWWCKWNTHLLNSLKYKRIKFKNLESTKLLERFRGKRKMNRNELEIIKWRSYFIFIRFLFFEIRMIQIILYS